MKKRILTIAAVCVAAACLGACNSSRDDKAVANEYDGLNEKLNLNYSRIILTVTDKFDESTELKSKYVMEYSDGGITVNYTVERFSEISIDAPTSVVKTTYTGEAIIKDGAVEYVNGADIDLSAEITKAGLNFKEEYFENAEITGNYFKADVKDAGAFTGSELTCTDMKVFATYHDVLYDLEIKYKDENGNMIEYVYKFVL